MYLSIIADAIAARPQTIAQEYAPHDREKEEEEDNFAREGHSGQEIHEGEEEGLVEHNDKGYVTCIPETRVPFE